MDRKTQKQSSTLHVEYDPEVDAAFIWLTNNLHKGLIHQELWPPELHDKIGLLFDSQSKLIGIEVLEATRLLLPTVVELP